MAELDDRLLRSISSAYPTVSEEEILKSDLAQLMNVDSLAAVTLLAVIDDEFGVDLDLETLLRLRTFDAIRQYLHRQGTLVLWRDETRIP